MRHAPQDRIVRRELAQDVVNAAQGFEGALAVRVEDKRQGPPRAFPEKTESGDSPALTNRIQASCWEEASMDGEAVFGGFA